MISKERKILKTSVKIVTFQWFHAGEAILFYLSLSKHLLKEQETVIWCVCMLSAKAAYHGWGSSWIGPCKSTCFVSLCSQENRCEEKIDFSVDLTWPLFKRVRCLGLVLNSDSINLEAHVKMFWILNVTFQNCNATFLLLIPKLSKFLKKFHCSENV